MGLTGTKSIVNMGAVVANAVHDAVGARVFEMSVSPARVKAALDRPA